jgi:hypothetical protein
VDANLEWGFYVLEGIRVPAMMENSRWQLQYAPASSANTAGSWAWFCGLKAPGQPTATTAACIFSFAEPRAFICNLFLIVVI